MAHRFNAPFNAPLLALACLVGTALSAQASSTAGSSVSDSVSTSVGSVSDSIKKSSDSSSKDKQVAAGDYQVIDVATVADKPGMVRLTLQALAQPTAAEGRFELLLPQAALAQGQVAQGAVVSARQRPYGMEFAKAETQTPFFLVLHDTWYRELNSHAVVL